MRAHHTVSRRHLSRMQQRLSGRAFAPAVFVIAHKAAARARGVRSQLRIQARLASTHCQLQTYARGVAARFTETLACGTVTTTARKTVAAQRKMRSPPAAGAAASGTQLAQQQQASSDSCARLVADIAAVCVAVLKNALFGGLTCGVREER